MQRSKFPSAFYIANTMEIFERLAWYGFFTVSSLYMTSPKSQGGLGFSDIERGFLQGIIPFMLYLLPVITGALADRYGYKRMFILSFTIMTPSYFLLGQVESFWSFCFVFMAVALGAAIFKPLVVGTVGRVTDDSNRGLGFGIFYTMVNIGGFLGPLIAGYVRVIGWDMVFVMSALWIAVNFIPGIFFFKEPVEVEKSKNKSLATVLHEAQQVLGNGRLALLVIPIIILLMLSAKLELTLTTMLSLIIGWVILNLVWDRIFTHHDATKWYASPIKVGNKAFLSYLLILTGFWTMYLQVFITTPLYIRDFVDTQDAVIWLQQYFPITVDFLAAVNKDLLVEFLNTQLASQQWLSEQGLQTIYTELVSLKVMVPQNDILVGFTMLANQTVTSAELAQQWITKHRQINPEFIINIDFAAIILFQLFISHICKGRSPIPVIVAGTCIIAGSFLIGGLAHGVIMGGAIICSSIFLFAVGEMVASPKSHEYVAALAPKEHTAMYMGYFFVSMALGNLFAGLLSGWSYSYFAKELNSPMMLWGFFAGIGIISGGMLLLLNSYWLPKWRKENNQLLSLATE